MKNRRAWAILVVGIAVVLFLKDDKLKGEARARVFREADAALSMAKMDQDYIEKTQELKRKAQELAASVKERRSDSDKASELFEKAQLMEAKAIAKEQELTENRTKNLRRYNGKASEFNKLPRSMFHEKANVPRTLEIQQEI